MITDTDICRKFNLRHNPFAEKFKTELKPRSEGDIKWYAQVDGFGRQVAMIEGWFASPQSQDKLSVSLVSGPGGSGRNSVANYILYHFLQARNLAYDNICIIEVRIGDDHKISPVREAMRILYKKLKRNLRIRFEGDQEALEQKYLEDVLPDKYLSLVQYNQILWDTVELLRGQGNYEVVFVLDNVLDYRQINNSLEVFKDCTPLVLYTTLSRTKVYDNFRDALNTYDSDTTGFAIRLSALKREDVEEFLRQRWQMVSDIEHHPFHRESLDTIFGGDNLPFQRVVTILTRIFRKHLEDHIHSDHQQEDFPPIPERTMWIATVEHYQSVSGDV